MTYRPGFGLPGLTSPISEIRKAVADLEAMPSEPFKDGQLVMMRETLKIAEELEAEGIPTGPYRAPTPAKNE